MNFPDRDIVSKPRTFVSEQDLEERRKQRQEEWEKTRKPDDPQEAPEEEYDHRTLFERLQENKMKKEAEYEEQHKLKNMIRGLDSDEVAFLETVDQTKILEEKLKEDEEVKALEDFRKANAHLTQEEQERKLTEFKKSLWSSKETSASKKSLKGQAALLSKVVKRKATPEESPSKKPAEEPTLKVIGVLPGIGYYGSDSSNSENSGSDVDDPHGLSINFSVKPTIPRQSTNHQSSGHE